jgi:hypothetical protein
MDEGDDKSINPPVTRCDRLKERERQMKKRIMSLVASTLLVSSAMPAFAAPLFPDVKDDHWAKDAVAALAAKGLLEGYPDGTFKGDRAATRWEVAMIVARLLAKMEQAHATFATKAELEELRKLVNALKDELDALGVRVTNLEENVGRLDKRVTELERITFYGYVDTRGSFGAFQNTNSVDNSNGAGAPGVALASVPGPPYLNYNNGVGSLGGSSWSPQVTGNVGVQDYRTGRPLVNGAGMTARATLGLRVRVSDDIDAGIEFSAFSAQGNSIIDAYQGVSAPWQSNPFTASLNGSPGTLGNVPWTKMTLDNFWVVHNPSHTKLIVGNFQEMNIDPLIFAGEYNPNANGPRFLGGYGFDAQGKVDVSNAGVFRWEALGSQIADGSPYTTFLIGADAEFEFEGGSIKANFARVNQDGDAVGDVRTTAGTGLGAGLAFAAVPLGSNVASGASGGYTALQWVNPAGYYFAQESQFQQNGRGVGTIDNRPIPGQGSAVNGTLSDIGGSGALGPQGELLYGATANYKWDVSGGDAQIYIAGNYGHSDYKPNANSAYQTGGNAFRAEVGANLLDGDLDLSAQYVRVDPNYDPFVLTYPFGVGVNRLPDMNYYQGLYSLHDTSVYPQNREGVRLSAQWRFDERRGLLWAKASLLQQTDTSLYDVRVLGSSIGGNTPTANVVGFAPGFMDPVFAGYAHPNVYGAGSGNAFSSTLQPLDDHNGQANSFGVGGSYKFDDPRVKVDVGYTVNSFYRGTSLGPQFGGSQDEVKLNIQSFHSQVNWEASDQWTLKGGVDWTQIQGHLDPAGLFNSAAIAFNSVNFHNIDSKQLSPFVGFNYDISANTQWNMDLRYYSTTSGTNIPANFAKDSVGASQNPFEWNGWQVSTQFKVKF